MQELKCKNCGAPLNDSVMKCEYCGTSYVKEDKDDLPKIDRIVKSEHILTPNEARQAINLKSVQDYSRTLRNEISYVREGPNVFGVYDTDGNRIKTFCYVD